MFSENNRGKGREKGNGAKTKRPAVKAAHAAPVSDFTQTAPIWPSKSSAKDRKNNKKRQDFWSKQMYVHAVARTARNITVLVAVCFTVKITRQSTCSAMQIVHFSAAPYYMVGRLKLFRRASTYLYPLSTKLLLLGVDARKRPPFAV